MNRPGSRQGGLSHPAWALLVAALCTATAPLAASQGEGADSCRLCPVKPAGGGRRAAPAAPFQRRWTHVSETSAVVYWQLGDISKAATSYVELGETRALGRKTDATRQARWSHFHRLLGLKVGATYYYRMVVADPGTGKEARSEILALATRKSDAIRIPGEVSGPPFVLDQPGASYVLTEDVAADGTAFEITAPGVTLDLDGHTVIFGNNTTQQVRGVWAHNKGKATICNGHIVQGARSKAYSTAVESRWRTEPTEVFAISTDVRLKCAYPIKFLGRAADVRLHHNDLRSSVVEIESRHYPGNDLIRLDIAGPNIHVHDNLLTEGCHVGIRLTKQKNSAPLKANDRLEVHHNDIRHHQQFVNGYAIAAGCPQLRLHHNKITSSGRGVHLTAEGIRLHDNYLDTFGHQQLDDMPKGSRPFAHIRVELHGIKFEGSRVKNCKVFNNFVRIVQRLPRASAGLGRPEDKIDTGVYVRSMATKVVPGGLLDETQNWERDRWRGYFLKYDPKLPPALITGNGPATLLADVKSGAPREYTVYMKWDYVPATPLNIACYDPNAMNEVYGNTFVALTKYPESRHGGYGRSGQWASAIQFVGMKKGPAEPGKYSVYIHDNRFVSNHLFANSHQPVNMTVRIEKNSFVLAEEPPPVKDRRAFRNLGDALERIVKTGGNLFEGTLP